MILVWRICAECSRRFSFWYDTLGDPPMQAVCQPCQNGTSHAH